MQNHYLPEINKEKLEAAIASSDDNVLFGLLTEPLHEELYRRQDFNFLDDLSEGQQLILSYDYLVNQVGQGGFIQFLANGYIGLLPDMPGWLQAVGAHEMAQLVDDVIKVYVLNHELFAKQSTPEEFAGLYRELTEFEVLEERFNELHEATLGAIMHYVRNHLDEFVAL